MAQTLLDFFDEDYFSPACICGNNPDLNEEICKVHGKVYGPSISDADTEKGGGYTVRQVTINQSFPRQPTQDHLATMIEYRVKVLSNHSVIIGPGEIITLETNLSIGRKAGKLSLLIKPPEGLPLRFLSEGLLNPGFRGRLSVKFESPSSVNVHLPAGSITGYLILSPFIE